MQGCHFLFSNTVLALLPVLFENCSNSKENINEPITNVPGDSLMCLLMSLGLEMLLPLNVNHFAKFWGKDCPFVFLVQTKKHISKRRV